MKRVMAKWNRLKLSILKRLIGSPVSVRHFEVSLLYSADDDKSKASKELITIAADSIKEAQKTDLSFFAKRSSFTEYDIWPGEHYKLLAGLTKVTKPKVAIDIGTYFGHSALSIKKCMPAGGKLVTFDLLAWNTFKQTCLKKSDFDNSFEQYLEDLSDPKVAKKHKKLLQSADLIFIDAPKDGIMEYKLLKNFQKIGLKDGALLVFDDIRVWTMLRFWRNLRYPKLDLTSFGHWSGTGLVQWKNK